MSLIDFEVADWLTANQDLVDKLAELRQNKLDYAPIFTDTPDDTFIKIENTPWIRVTGFGDGAVYADNQRLFERPNVQVDFWVREENVDRLEEIAEEIYRTMKQHYFERTDFNHERDPDFNGCIMVRNVFAGIKERTADNNG
ncbi:hypothetical protein [Ligilactobacillus salivarius]|uniref:hypothetical protein n=1 Tax=Ligilactobacillus salivarius TaxID=1624 RepID=UPI001651BF21|nr:hypothetical protein [Ligilactobacillus salivarius]MBC6925095.1 hypothetical protein [Ligilactobacillus salivarius]MDD1403489.1 hypothetical protein [Ligilactobacillus salivarius]